jgi:prepilin-type N-terminal cleavage/methylation domain-containing protein
MQLRSDERGVTLPEVLVAVAILAIIIIPLGDAMIGFVGNTDATTRRMIESHDMQIATAYFAQDVQDLGVRDWSSPTLALRQSIDNTSYPSWTCTSAGTSVISLAWDDFTVISSLTVVRVNYVVRDVGGEHQLRRLLCKGSPTAVTVPIESDLVLVHNLVGTPPPVRACLPTTCTSATVPQRVTLTLTVKHPSNATGIPLTLTGQRRQT